MAGTVMNWVSYQPAYLLIPLFENMAEKVAVVSYGVAVLCSIGTVVYVAGLAIKKGSFENRLLCASQIFWLAWVCLQIVCFQLAVFMSLSLCTNYN